VLTALAVRPFAISNPYTLDFSGRYRQLDSTSGATCSGMDAHGQGGIAGFGDSIGLVSRWRSQQLDFLARFFAGSRTQHHDIREHIMQR
jgi:hypothetical protein